MVLFHHLSGWIYHLWLVVVWLVSTLIWLTIGTFHVFKSCFRAICSQLNITLRLEENISVPSTCFLSTRQRIIIYSACTASAIVISFTRAILFYFICVNASRVLHNRMFASVLRAPVHFFDTNTIGKYLLVCNYGCGQLFETHMQDVFWIASPKILVFLMIYCPMCFANMSWWACCLVLWCVFD